MKPINEIKITLLSKSNNESFARAAVAAFVAQLDPTVEELNDIKTAVSEAVTNCIVHAYRENLGNIYITLGIYENRVIKLKIKDKGCGIENLEQAMTPMYSSLGGERAGLGFAVMQTFMDKLSVRSAVNKGTTVTMSKRLSFRAQV